MKQWNELLNRDLVCLISCPPLSRQAVRDIAFSRQHKNLIYVFVPRKQQILCSTILKLYRQKCIIINSVIKKEITVAFSFLSLPIQLFNFISALFSLAAISVCSMVHWTGFRMPNWLDGGVYRFVCVCVSAHIWQVFFFFFFGFLCTLPGSLAW